MNKRPYRNDTVRRMRDAQVKRAEAEYNSTKMQKEEELQNAGIQSEVVEGSDSGPQA